MMQPQYETAACRTCGRKIIWTTSPTGAHLPLDARAVTVYAIVPDGDALRAEKAERLDHSAVYVSHFTSCPNASAHSRGGRQGRAN